MHTLFQKWKVAIYHQTSFRWLVVFRILVGVLFFYKALSDTSLLYDRYAVTDLFFPFRGYDWLGTVDYPTIQ